MGSTLITLATRILANATEVENYFEKNDLPKPSFEPGAGAPLESPEIEQARISAIEDSIELHDLLLGPKLLLRPMYNATSLHAVYRFDIASKIPLNSDVSYAELAKICRLYEPDLKRIVRFAICYHRVFCEPRKDYVAHSAASLLIAQSQDVRDALGVMFDDVYQAYARTVDAMERYPERALNETGYALSHDTDLSFYQYLAAHLEKSSRFAGAMRAFESGPDISPSYLITGFNWSVLGNGLVVDIGGSLGAISIAIATAHPSLHFIVQDRPEVVQTAWSQNLPDHITNRVRFMSHDFLTPQTVTADLYLFRNIFHNWPDKYVVHILKQLVGVMRKGARVLVNETLLPKVGSVGHTREREVRSMDMLMLTLCNGRERDEDDWKAILKDADARFCFVGTWTPDGSSVGIVEIVWEG